MKYFEGRGFVVYFLDDLKPQKGKAIVFSLSYLTVKYLSSNSHKSQI